MGTSNPSKPIFIPNQADVSSSGDDASGKVGYPAFPFATMQGAANAIYPLYLANNAQSFVIHGATPDNLGGVSYLPDGGDGVYIWPVNIAVTGVPGSFMTISLTALPAGDMDNGNDASINLSSDGIVTLSLSAISSSGGTGTDTNGGNASITLFNVNCVSPTVTAGAGNGAGSSGGSYISITATPVFVANATNAGSASNADYATNAGSASDAYYATNAGSASNADYATNAGGASDATNADYATNAGNATYADYASNAGSASNADYATNAGNADAIANGAAGDGLTWTTPPSSASSTGTTGQIAFDGAYIYLCTATDTWVRTPVVYTTW